MRAACRVWASTIRCFNDEQLHSVQKILEMQYINTKVWAFINLKTFMKTAQVQQLARSVTRCMVGA